LEGQLETQDAMFPSLVVPFAEHNMKIESCHHECSFSHEASQELDTTLTKQIVKSLLLEVRECGLQRDKLSQFIETQTSERKVSSDDQRLSTTKDASLLADFKVTPLPTAPSVSSQQPGVSSVLSKTHDQMLTQGPKHRHEEVMTDHAKRSAKLVQALRLRRRRKTDTP